MLLEKEKRKKKKHILVELFPILEKEQKRRGRVWDSHKFDSLKKLVFPWSIPYTNQASSFLPSMLSFSSSSSSYSFLKWESIHILRKICGQNARIRRFNDCPFIYFMWWRLHIRICPCLYYDLLKSIATRRLCVFLHFSCGHQLTPTNSSNYIWWFQWCRLSKTIILFLYLIVESLNHC